MPLDATGRLQANSGTVTTAGTSCTPSLPNPTTQGSTLLLWIGMNGSSLTFPSSADPPWYQDQAVAGNWYALRRDNQPGGETSWPMSSISNARWGWRAEEWTALSFTGQPDATSEFLNGAGSQANNTYNTGSGSPATTDVADFAALVFYFGGSSGTTAFPAGRSYTSGWSQTDYLTVGSGTTAGDFAMAFAESYPGVAGAVDCTLTWDTTGGGSYANVTTYGTVSCYQPGIPLPFGILTG